MKGETALRIITATAFVFIFVFILAAGGISGESGTAPVTTTTTPTPTVTTPVQTTAPVTTVPETPTPTTIATPATTEPTETDPVAGLWVFKGSSTEKLLLNSGGGAEMTTIDAASSSVREGAWKYDPTIRVGNLRAYRLAIANDGEYVLYLDEKADTLRRNGQGAVVTYTSAS